MSETVEDIAVNIGDTRVGRLLGLVFLPENITEDIAIDALNATVAVLIGERLRKLIDAGDAALRLHDDGLYSWELAPVGRLLPGEDVLSPNINPLIDERASETDKITLKNHLEAVFGRYRQKVLGTLLQLDEHEAEGRAAEFARALFISGGTAPRADAEQAIRELTTEDRAGLRQKQIRIGEYFVFVRELLRPEAIRLKLLLQGIYGGTAPVSPPEVGVPAPAIRGTEPPGYWELCGYMPCGERAVRCDIIEKLADLVREPSRRSNQNPTGEFTVTPAMMSLVGRSGEAFADVLRAMGFVAQTRTEVIEPRPTAGSVSASAAEGAEAAPETPEEPTARTYYVWARRQRRAEAPAGGNRISPAKADNSVRRARLQQAYAAVESSADAVISGIKAERTGKHAEGKKAESNKDRNAGNDADPNHAFAGLAFLLAKKQASE